MYNKYCDLIGHSEARGCSILSKAKWNCGPPTDKSDSWPTLPYNTLQYLIIPTLPYKYCDPIGHSEARGCSIPSKTKWNSGPPTDQSDSWPTLPYNTLQYLKIPYNTLQYLQYLHYPIVVTNTVIWLVTQRPEAEASKAKWNSGGQYCE